MDRTSPESVFRFKSRFHLLAQEVMRSSDSDPQNSAQLVNYRKFCLLQALRIVNKFHRPLLNDTFAMYFQFLLQHLASPVQTLKKEALVLSCEILDKTTKSAPLYGFFYDRLIPSMFSNAATFAWKTVQYLARLYF